MANCQHCHEHEGHRHADKNEKSCEKNNHEKGGSLEIESCCGGEEDSRFLLTKPSQRLARAIGAGGLLILGFLVARINGIAGNEVLRNWLQIGIWILSYLLVSFDVLIGAVKSLWQKKVMDENFLMGIASIGAMAIGEYPEGIAVMIFFQLGEYFQDKAVAKSKKSIAELIDIKPNFANLIKKKGLRVQNSEKSTELVQIKPEEIKVGDQLLIKVGEKIPVDGIVIEGESSLNTKALTGESLPREVAVGDEVISGCINEMGVISIQATKVYADSTVNKVLELVETAGVKKSATERFITRFARIYTPVVVALTILIILVMPFWGGWSSESFVLWLERALVFLVVSCPCALVISVPLSFVGGLGSLASQGVLVKGTTYLEALTKVGTLVFDKTGTLTTGEFAIEKMTNNAKLSKLSDSEFLEMVLTMESFSNHPLATSLVKNYEGKQQLSRDKVTNFQEIAGEGVLGGWKKKRVLIGNQKLMTRFGIKTDTFEADEWDKNSKNEQEVMVGTQIWVAKEKEVIGYLVLEDQLKTTAKNVVTELKSRGQQIVMLTGDNEKVAAKVAAKVGAENYVAELLPENKMAEVDKLIEHEMEKDSKKERKVAVIGDGINDAPILMRADIGIAMGEVGSQAAIEAADIVIMTDELTRIPLMMSVAKQTVTIAKQNISLALGIKVLVMSLSFFGFMSMWLAVFADVGVTILAIMNALRALKIKD